MDVWMHRYSSREWWVEVKCRSRIESFLLCSFIPVSLLLWPFFDHLHLTSVVMPDFHFCNCHLQRVFICLFFNEVLFLDSYCSNLGFDTSVFWPLQFKKKIFESVHHTVCTVLEGSQCSNMCSLIYKNTIKIWGERWFFTLSVNWTSLNASYKSSNTTINE